MKQNQFAAMFMAKRGYTNEESRRAFLEFSPDRLRRAGEMTGGSALLERLAAAVGKQEYVTVYGDYDADGVMASCIFYMGLVKLIPGKVSCYINNRFDEGYNITAESIANLLERFPKTNVILTCDNGISAGDAVDTCLERGISFLVTDHHEQLLPLPEGCIAVDEKSDAQKKADAGSRTAREDFCGAELARRVVTELYERLGEAEKESGFLDSLYAYSGLATITDVVPMNAANHYVARRGIGIIRRGEGVWGLLNRQWDRDGNKIREDTIGFCYGPMINACGRVEGSATRALRAFAYHFHGNEAMSAREFEELFKINLARREMCSEDEQLALKIVEQEGYDKDPFILVAHDDFREGINGLTAAWLTNRYGVPSAVLSPVKNDPQRLKGSARAPETFNLINVLKAHQDLIRAGGHAQAAGFSIRREDLGRVREILNEETPEASQTEAAGPEPDMTMDIASLTAGSVEEMTQAVEMLMPFGPGFEAPRIAFTGQADMLRTDRASGTHAFLTLKGRSADAHPVEVVWWKHYKETWEIIRRESRDILCIGTPGLDNYLGTEKIRITATQISAADTGEKQMNTGGGV